MKGITDFRCGINRLSEIIRDKQTVNVFDNVAFIFICKNKQGVASASQLVFIANMKDKFWYEKYQDFFIYGSLLNFKTSLLNFIHKNDFIKEIWYNKYRKILK